jgi:hypothetical protein
MKISTVSSKRQITLTTSELAALGVEPGGKLLVEPWEDGLRLRPLPGTPRRTSPALAPLTVRQAAARSRRHRRRLLGPRKGKP